MAQIKKILFYSDSYIYGGHEIMSVKIANLLYKYNYKVEFIYYNKKISEKLDKPIVKHFTPYYDKAPLPFIRNLNFYKILKLKNRINKINPDIVVICQGNIELCLKGLIASYLSNAKALSYIPTSQYFRSIKSIFYRSRDVIGNIIFNMPNFYIVPNEYQNKIIKKRISNKEVFIVPNPLDFNINNSNIFSKNDTINIGIIGKINLRIKNQSIALPISKKLKNKKIKFKFHIIGDGKDLLKFKSLVEKDKLSKDFVFYGWLDDEEKKKIIQNHIDIIMVPSLTETGLPLVVYDAFENDKKFLMSNIDSIKEYNIPDDFVININDLESTVDKIIYLATLLDSSEYEFFRNKIFGESSESKFENSVQKTFAQILCGH